MGWAKIPKTDLLRAGKHWLANLEPTKDAKRRKQFKEFKHKVEAALSNDKELLKIFVATVEMARLLGKADGMREGLELYEYGLKIERKSAASRAAIKCIVNNPEKLTTKKICSYLDKELVRIEKQKTSEASIKPPEAWGCETWAEARTKHRNRVEVLFSEARRAAKNDQYVTLMAWRTWGEMKQRKSKIEVAATSPTSSTLLSKKGRTGSNLSAI